MTTQARRRQVGARIVQMRRTRGLTQAQLSHRLPENVVPGYVSRWERGENLPSWENLRALGAGARRVGELAVVRRQRQRLKLA